MITISDSYETKYVVKSDSTTVTERVTLKTTSTSIKKLDDLLYELFNGNKIDYCEVVIEENTENPTSYTISNIKPVGVENLNSGKYEISFEGFTVTTAGLVIKSEDVPNIKITPKVYFENNVTGKSVNYLELGTFYSVAEDNVELDSNDEIWFKMKFDFLRTT
ncbi:MAG TPA: hypothetical protein ENG63_07690 [Candidatus Desulfofervidus auxilii]|uniref:Uncharacterized protein n=1 Tax=Desulfofervidus auxilii TaxID=1621989 RepID=A0A7C0U3F5_DESA2|nr:hypothetical protein [Candidatus Desulfofervidus auxilii]